MGVRVRLVKGAYKEPKTVAFQDKSQVDAAFIELMRELLDHGTFPAIATHDPAMIDATKRYARGDAATAKDRFEFQMLYGIRRDLQASLVAEGYGMRIYVPYGRQWFPYFMRRLGERPANVAFVLRGLRPRAGSTRASRPRSAARTAASSATSASRQAITLATSTHSSTPCSPAPTGPKSSDGMPASPSTDASVQKLIP